jgi:peptide deformylase
MKTIIALTLLALVSAPSRAQQDPELQKLLGSLRTTSLMRIAVALSAPQMPGLKPAVRTRALQQLKATNHKISMILDNPKLAADKRKQRLIQAQNEGALNVGRELGADVKKLKEGFLSLKNGVFWDVPVYGGFSAEALSTLKKQIQAADVYGGSSDFFIAGWGDVG